MPSVTRQCPRCKKLTRAEISAESNPACPLCRDIWPVVSKEFNFKACPFCECSQFYIQKDFNQALGCLVLLVGIVSVPKTYGLSLPIVALIDWLLYRKVATIVLCYRCGAEFRGFEAPKNLKAFFHHIGEKYDR